MKIIYQIVLYVNGIPTLLKKVQFRKFQSNIRYAKKTFIIDSTKPSYQSNATYVFLIDFEKGSQIFLEKNEERTPNAELVDTIVNQTIIDKITHNIGQDKKELFLYAFLGVILGALLSALICVIYYSNEIRNILSGITEPENVVLF